MAQIPMDYAGFLEIAPGAQAGLVALGRAVDEAGLDKKLSELLKLRVSQINGCLFCLDLHLDLAGRLGLTRREIDFLSVWREADCYDARQRAVLGWAEALTLVVDHASMEATRAGLLAVFEPAKATQVTVAIGTINAWNRIARGLGFPARTPVGAA